MVNFTWITRVIHELCLVGNWQMGLILLPWQLIFRYWRQKSKSDGSGNSVYILHSLNLEKTGLRGRTGFFHFEGDKNVTRSATLSTLIKGLRRWVLKPEGKSPARRQPLKQTVGLPGANTAGLWGQYTCGRGQGIRRSPGGSGPPLLDSTANSATPSGKQAFRGAIHPQTPSISHQYQVQKLSKQQQNTSKVKASKSSWSPDNYITNTPKWASD